MQSSEDSLTQACTARYGYLRSDLFAVDFFVPSYARPTGEGSGGINERVLFWSVVSPEEADIDISTDVDLGAFRRMAPLPPAAANSPNFVSTDEDLRAVRPARTLRPPPEFEPRFLGRLGALERQHRVPYEPDRVQADDPAWDELERRLVVSLHLAAARAMALQRRDGYSDDVRDCLRTASRCGTLLKIHDMSVQGRPFYLMSAGAVYGWTQVELGRMAAVDGDEALALRNYVLGMDCLRDAGWWWLCSEPDTSEDPDGDLYGIWLLNLIPSAQEVATVIERLLERRQDVDWQLIARHCQDLRSLWGDDLWGELVPGVVDDLNTTVVEGSGREQPLLEFMVRAQARAEERLSTSELRAYLERREDEAAEERLTRYFFEPPLWRALSERARRSLIDADRAFVSARAGRVERLLADLQVATEALLFDLIWTPMREHSGDAALLEFVQRDLSLQEKQEHPSLDDYEWLCRRACFAQFLDRRAIKRDERTFLTRELPSALGRLRRERNRAEHDPTHRPRPATVRALFAEYVGIGCQGVLPRLASLLP